MQIIGLFLLFSPKFPRSPIKTGYSINAIVLIFCGNFYKLIRPFAKRYRIVYASDRIKLIDEEKGDTMNKDVHDKLSALINELGKSLSDKKSGQPIKLTRKNSKLNSKKVELKNLVGSLDDLRIGIKYVLFDLEATRRENSFLKRQIQDLS